MNQGQQFRCDQPAVYLGGVVVRLRVVAVNLGNAAWFHVAFQQLPPADHSELKRTLYTANFVFLFKTNVPNELIPINPLGLAITYFREDEAFK